MRDVAWLSQIGFSHDAVWAVVRSVDECGTVGDIRGPFGERAEIEPQKGKHETAERQKEHVEG